MLVSRSLRSETELYEPAGKHLLSVSTGLHRIFTKDKKVEFYFLMSSRNALRCAIE